MTTNRPRSRSPDTLNKRMKYSRDDGRRHHEYKYEDEDYSRSRFRDDHDRDHAPRLYRVDDRDRNRDRDRGRGKDRDMDRRRDDSRERYRDNDRERRRDDESKSRFHHDERDRRREDDRRQHRRHYEEDDKNSRGRERDKDRDRDRESKDGRRGVNGSSTSSPHHSADNRSRSPQPTISKGRTTSPNDVTSYKTSTDVLLQKAQMTDIQRARLGKMELWKKRKAAEAAAKSGKTSAISTNETSTNLTPSSTLDTITSTGKGMDLLETALKHIEGSSKLIPAFGFTRATSKISGNQSDLEFDDEDATRRKLEMLPTLTAEDEARINAASMEEDAEDQDTKLDDDDEEERKHMKREESGTIVMEIDEGDRLPNRVCQKGGTKTGDERGRGSA